MDAPWLQACKRLAVGQTARFRCCGRTPAAVIFNKVDAWEMYCHRCHEPQKVRKQYVTLMQTEVLPRVLPAPEKLIQIHQTSAELQAQLYGFLVSKGIMPEMAGAVYYSEQLKRLVWDLQNGTYLARALHQYQQPKWVMLGEPVSYAEASTVVNPDAVVLTEDYLSSLKIKHCMEIYGGSTSICSIALLGTRLSLPLKAKLIQLGKPVLLMLDNDEAGWAGAKTIQRTLKPFLPVHDRVLRDDPKACNISEILEGLK